MKAAALVFVIGFGLVVFGIVLITTAGCTREPCGPSVNEISFSTGIGLMIVAVLHAIWRLGRRCR